MTAGIVVSRRDGVLTAPDGTKWRVARGKTLADADHPAVLANPGDWAPMVITLTVGDHEPTVDDDPRLTPEAIGILDDLRGEIAELEETLAQRDAELFRLAEGLAARGVVLPAEDDREPGWLVDLVLAWMDRPLPPAVTPPPKPRKRAAPPRIPRPGDDG